MKEGTIEVRKNELMTDLLLLEENAKLIVDFINSEVQYNNIKVSSKKKKFKE
jgi:hypothetical protein